MGANPRSTVGTATDANAMLRILFSRIGKPHIGPPTAFAFNVPTRTASGVMKTDKGQGEKTVVREAVYQGGMCPRCEGMGSVNDFDLTAIYDESKSLAEGALLVPGYSMDGWYGRIFSGAGFDMDKPIGEVHQEGAAEAPLRRAEKIKVEGVNLTYEGVHPQDPEVDALQGRRGDAAARPPRSSSGRSPSRPARTATAPGSARRRCPRRSRARTSPTCARCRSATSPSGCATSTSRRSRRCSPGCSTCSTPSPRSGSATSRSTGPPGTLSGGEAQRTKMIRHLGSSLTDVTYVFDEPTIGLHPHDIERMNQLLLQLRDKGNTVLVVEHKPETIAIADHVVDLGPGAGTAGGDGLLRGHRRGAARERHHHRPPPRRPGAAQGVGARRRPARWRSAARPRTTCRTSTSTSRSACSACSPASPAPARAR